MMRPNALSPTRGMSPSEAAAHWVVRQDGRLLNARDQAEFDAWHGDPANAAAFRSVSAVLTLFDEDRDNDLNLKALRQSALEAEPTRPRGGRWIAGMAIAASVAATIIFVGFQPSVTSSGSVPGLASIPTRIMPKETFPASIDPTEYRTGVGERRTVKLADGSSVTMNTQTRLAVLFTAGRRIIRLSRGQALFEVAHDASRPFSVEAADRQVTALGTIFEVRVDPGRVKVILVRGRVVVDRAADTRSGYVDTPMRPTILKPGEQFEAPLGAPQTVSSVDVDRQLLWRRGFVEFRDDALSHAVAEINRYSPKLIVLKGDGVASLRLSGLYRTDSPEQFIDAVQAILPVDSRINSRGEIELSLAEGRIH